MKTKPRIMGIINTTHDSFYAASRLLSQEQILDKVNEMISHGADIIDVGGCSTRPSCNVVNEETETRRVIPAIKAIRESFPHVTISVDTFRGRVAEKAVCAGADIINDISGGEFDESILQVVRESGKTYVLMHNRGLPHVMNSMTQYTDVCSQVAEYMDARIKTLQDMGICDMVIDPGFGFAKDVKQNFLLLAHTDVFKQWGFPVLVGVSRKSMIWKTLDITPEESLNGTTVLNTIALMYGADILRVHDVKEAAQAIKLVGMMSNN